MIIIMKPDASSEAIQNIVSFVKSNGLDAHLSCGKEVTIIGVIGNKSLLADKNLEIFEGVDRIVSVTESYKLANKKFHPDPTVVKVKDVTIGGGSLTIFSGPCAIENRDQIIETALAIKKSGATVLRGGAYKPRTSPYTFQGLEVEGLQMIHEASQISGLPVICEVTSLQAIEAAAPYVDILQIGARNMQNFYLLKEAGKSGIPVMLKRGLSATIDEWLNASEYILAEGNPNVILCERGIRTYETSTRNTLDISAVPVIQKKSHLPIVVDPSHASGVRSYVKPLALAAVAAGADGLMIETHPNPSIALSDGAQSLTFEQFDELCSCIRPLAALVGKTF